MNRVVSYPNMSTIILESEFTPANTLSALKMVDGAGSALDADTVQGHAVVQQGTGPGQNPAEGIEIGWDNTHVRLAHNGVDQGFSVEESELISVLQSKEPKFYTPAQLYKVIATVGSISTDTAIDADGNLYLTFANNRNDSTYNLTSYVYKITPQGVLSVFASVATSGIVDTSLILDNFGNLYWSVCNQYNGTTYVLTSYVYKITPAGSLSTFASVTTTGAYGTSLAFDALGNLYWAVCNYYNGTTYAQTSYLYKITPAGSLSTFASVATAGGYGTSLVFDAAGNLYWAVMNYYNGTTHAQTSYVYKITPAGSLSTFTSIATTGGVSTSLAFDAAGNLYWAVCNYYNGTIHAQTSYLYKITPAGSLSTFASVATRSGYGASIIFDDNGNLYWSLSNYYDGTTYALTAYVYRITPAGSLSTFASAATAGGAGTSLSLDAAGNLYWAVCSYSNEVTTSLNSHLYISTKQSLKG